MIRIIASWCLGLDRETTTSFSHCSRVAILDGFQACVCVMAVFGGREKSDGSPETVTLLSC